MENNVSVYQRDKERTILTEAETHVACLRMIGHARTSRSDPPLDIHIHGGCMEIVAVLKGKQTYRTEETDYTVSGGEIFLSFKDQPHSSAGERQSFGEMIWLQVDMNYRTGFLGLSPEYGEILHNRLGEIRSHLLPLSAGDVAMLRGAFGRFLRMTDTDRQAGAAMLTVFLSGLGDKMACPDRPESEFAELLAYIEKNPGERLDTARLARMCYLSESRFKHKFSQMMGMTPGYYIHSRRIAEAKRRLRLPEYATGVARLAQELGYGSAGYFSTVFRRFTGLSPTEFMASAGAKPLPGEEARRAAKPSAFVDNHPTR